MEAFKSLMITAHQFLWDKYNYSHFTVKEARYPYTYVQQETEWQCKDTFKIILSAIIFITWTVSSYPGLTPGLQSTSYSLGMT